MGKSLFAGLFPASGRAAGGAAPAARAAFAQHATAGSVLVRIEAVHKTFLAAPAAIKALDDVSLTIHANEFLTLLGPSGCGKSTLLRMLAGFEHPDRGAITLDGRDILSDPPNRRPINIVFQSYALFPHLSVAENIAFGLERLGRSAGEVGARVADMLALVRLDAHGGRRPHQLSGGQQQRVALARALAPAPKLLLLDEPMSALDVKLRLGMQSELKRMQRETGITFLLVTHDQDEALSMSSRIAVMNDGRVIQTGPPDAIYERPASCFVADFMGWNVLPGEALGLASRYAAIRPARVEVMPAGDGAGAGGGVLETTYLGERTACVIKLDAGVMVKAERPAALGRLEPGQRVFCHFPGDALVALEA